MSYHKTDTENNKPVKTFSDKKSGRICDNKCRKRPKKITPAYLHNAGLYYLERFAASKFHFKEVMMRKVKRSCLYHKDQDFKSCQKLVDDLADKFETCGFLNDEIYAHALASTMRRKGLSRRAIQVRMRNKGVGSEHISCALKKIDIHAYESSEDAEFAAALTLARKKKIGPYSCMDEQNTQKSLGILARAGFSYDIAKRVLDISVEDLEDFSFLQQ